MIARLKAFYRQQLIDPGLPALFINPHYLARKGLIDHIRVQAPRITGQVLDVGCGLKPYENLCRADTYIGLEIFAPRSQRPSAADLKYDGNRFPFKPDAFDAVVCSQVLEHVRRPRAFLSEIQRVTRTGGHLLLTVPFIWGEHEKPVDYQRYTSYGLKRLLDKTGFEVLTFQKSMPGMRALFALAAASLYEHLQSNNRPANLALALLSAAPLNIAGILCGLLLPENPDVYLDNIILGRKK